MLTRRTDLAMEARELWQESAQKTTELSGVRAEETTSEGYKITTVQIMDEAGERALDKPKGTYVTIELERAAGKDSSTFGIGTQLLKEELQKILQLKEDDTVLVVGLGNGAITSDAIGPETAKMTLVTRHLVEREPAYFKDFRRVAVVTSGVMGTTGIESAEIIKALVDRIKPQQVIVIDALASRKLSRVCRTVQLANTGIIPGSGVGNARMAISQKELGVPVTAIGVPTVVDIGTLAMDLAEEAGIEDLNNDAVKKYAGDMIVTPKDIDENVAALARLIGYGMNLALHQNLKLEDVTLFLD